MGGLAKVIASSGSLVRIVKLSAEIGRVVRVEHRVAGVLDCPDDSIRVLIR